MKTRHKQEWKTLADAYKEKREAAWKDRPSFKPIIAQHRADTRPEWSEFGKAQAVGLEARFVRIIERYAAAFKAAQGVSEGFLLRGV